MTLIRNAYKLLKQFKTTINWLSINKCMQILNMRKIWDNGAYGAVRPLGPVFLANISEMADLSGKRHAYSWMKQMK